MNPNMNITTNWGIALGYVVGIAAGAGGAARRLERVVIQERCAAIARNMSKWTPQPQATGRLRVTLPFSEVRVPDVRRKSLLGGITDVAHHRAQLSACC